MRRVLRVLLPVVVLVPMITAATPALGDATNVAACAGTYTIDLSVPMTLRNVQPPTSASFTMTLTGGACTGWGAPTPLQGGLGGNCGEATGGGWFPDGNQFLLLWAGASLIVVGDGFGTLAVTLPGSCTTPTGASTLEASGAIGPFADACAGIGQMYLSTPFNSTSTRTATFAISLGIGSCSTSAIEGRRFDAWGTITGRCGLASGSGTTSDGEPFTIEWVLPGGIVLAGNTSGYVSVTANPLTGSDCNTTWGASDFLAQGEVAKLR